MDSEYLYRRPKGRAQRDPRYIDPGSWDEDTITETEEEEEEEEEK